MSHLKTCPFCGSWMTRTAGSGRFTTHCEGCFASGAPADSMQGAIAAWNRRVPVPQEDAPDFRRELTTLINRHSKENGSNTPDFVLAAYMAASLAAFDQAAKDRDAWYGRLEAKPPETKE